MLQAERDPLAATQEWALPDHSFDEELDGVLEPAPRERRPDGTFLPKQQPAAASTAAEASTPPPAASHSTHLVQMALDLGVTQAEIDATQTPALEQTVRHLNRQMLALHERERQLAPPVQSPSSPTPPPEPEDDLAELGDLKADLDPRFAALLRRLVKENRELKAQVGQVQGYQQQRHNETRDEYVDRLFDENADELKFGKKSAGKGLTQDQLLRRRQIVQAAALKAGPKATEKEIVALILPVLEDLFGKSTTPAPTTNGARISKEDWEEAALARPTQRRDTPEPKGTRRAERSVVEKLRDMNIPLDEEGGIEEAGLPE